MQRARCEAAHARACLAEDGVLGGSGEVADEMQHMAAADSKAVHSGDNRLGQAADLLLYV